MRFCGGCFPGESASVTPGEANDGGSAGDRSGRAALSQFFLPEHMETIVSQDKIEHLPLDKVSTATQVRKEFPEEPLHGLMETLLAVGQRDPIHVRKEGDHYVILDGERRYRAMKMAGTFTTIAAIVEEQDLTPAAVQHRQLVANCQRENLTPMETATAIAELMEETGWMATEVAAKLGMSNANVSKLLALVELPPAVQMQIKQGAVPASAGYELSRIKDAGEQAALADQVANGQLTRDGLSGIIRRKGNQRKKDATESPARIKAELSNGRSVTLVGKGLDTLDTMIEWLEELLGHARKCRPRGLALGTFLRILKDEARA